MGIRYVIHTKDEKGHIDEAVQHLAAESIILGRGGRSDVIFKSRLISLEHARVSEQGERLLIEDLGSFSGVYVDSEVVSKQTLKAGSRIKLGDIELSVNRDQGGWILLEERVERNTSAVEASIDEKARSLYITAHLPSYKTLSGIFVLGLLAIFFVWPNITGIFAWWSSGPISNQHAMIANNCQACHSSPFVPVQDQQCLACHKLSEHSKAMPFIVKDFRELDWRCAQCHMEHNGNHHFTNTESGLCTTCHARLQTLYPDTKQPNIESFTDHSQFMVGVKRELVEGRDFVVKVSLDDKDKLIDPTHIKLNHQVHLKPGIRGSKGPVTLACGDCHRLAGDKRSIEPITFEKNCQSCHPLTFDDRLPSSQVPHGSPDVVFNYLYAEYAKLFMAEHGTKAAEIVATRFRPGHEAAPVRAAESNPTREAVERESRSTEKLLFTKTACLLCHDVSEKKGGESSNLVGIDPQSGLMVSRYQVLNPEIPSRWMPASTFSHGAHQELRCDSCHRGVPNSTETSDVLMPGIAGCRDCHHDPGRAGKVDSSCVMCHSYHDPLDLEDGTKRRIEEVLYHLGDARK